MSEHANHDDDRARPGVRIRKRARTRERLFQAALDEFRRVGIDATRIEHIAKRAKVVRGTFYFHFGSKENVLKELRVRAQNAMLGALETVDARGELAALLDAVEAGIEAAQTLAADEGLLRDALAVYVRRTHEGAPIPERSRVLFARVEATLKGLAARGQVRDDLPPDAMAELVLLSAFGLYAALRAEKRAGVRAVWKQTLLRGLAPPAART